jgi:hypothetical protein
VALENTPEAMGKSVPFRKMCETTLYQRTERLKILSITKFLIKYYTGYLKIREFRIQSVVGKDPVELEKYLEKKIGLPEEDISTLILFNT